MSTLITITLPDEIYQRAQRFAKLANRDVASFLTDTIQHYVFVKTNLEAFALIN
ncbi:MAG: hypothetical protein F6J96_06410 [Symploca sp. SIO1C2]|nr:hypothetical protein [Symploca sp. SIO1C2]